MNITQLYRNLLRLGAVYDKNPALKALIAAPELMNPKGLPKSFAAGPERLSVSSPINKVVKMYRHSFLDGSPFYDPLDMRSVVDEMQVLALWRLLASCLS